jgi:hypothetical protein
MEKDKICEKKPDPECILEGILLGKNVIRDNRYIVNHIGEAVYVDVFRVTPEELEEIKNFVSEIKKEE